MTRRETLPGRTVRQDIRLPAARWVDGLVLRTSSLAHRWIWRGLPAALLLAGCVTPLPMQPASALPAGTWRLGGQVAFAPWCTLSANPIGNCAVEPANVPLPELRLDARAGAGNGLDVGLSGRAAGVLSRGWQLGLLVDAKKELWSREFEPGRRQILSLGPALGADFTTLTLLPGRPTGVQWEGALPLYFGHQTAHFEWVVGARFVERLVPESAFRSGYANVEELGVVAGVYARGPLPWGVQLGYEAPLSYLSSGVFTLSAGVMLELRPGGAPGP